MGATLGNLHAQPKILKNYRNTKSTNQSENVHKKRMFSSLKCDGAKNPYGGYPTEFAPGA
jgi:hypothetical protein